MRTPIAFARTVAGPGAFVGAAIFLYAAMPFGGANSESNTVTASPGSAAAHAPKEGESVTTSLTGDQNSYLAEQNWEKWAGNGLAVWVSVDEQVLRIIQANTIVWQGACATAKNGAGSAMNSQKTPLGWHNVKRKVGDGAPIGQVFRGAVATKEVWKPGQSTKKDLVLTRILWLDGYEPGKNLGGNVDSYSRYIYIHGTNEEEKIGTPSSQGCVRMKNSDVIEVFALVPEGAPVLITEKKPASE
ncbi:MAG: L,D-transpeptidase [Candidatus Hydrogenedentes bacterium]|nr:L,D-transpeptidase [Candidatus Hydrogenedentota bacterium]